MPEYLAPGVYVEEVDTGSKPIEGVSTSTTGLVGVTERGEHGTSGEHPLVGSCHGALTRTRNASLFTMAASNLRKSSFPSTNALAIGATIASLISLRSRPSA